MRAAARATAALAVLGTLVAGCTGPAPEETASPTGTASPTTSPTAVALPDTPAGRQAAWVVEQMNAEVGTSLGVPEERFTAQLLAEVPADQLAEILDQLRAVAPWTVTAVEETPTAVVAQVSSAVQDLELQLSVDDEGLVQGLFFAPPTPPREPAADAAALVHEVGTRPGSSLYVAEVVDGRCVPVDDLTGGSDAGDALPIGSIVKLYVLGAVVDAVAVGDLAWDDELTVTDGLRSLPSGRLQDEPAGTVVTVEEAATEMIAISDNTATDLLIDAVGRGAVEQALADMGHADPAVNRPLATTRELFHLGWGPDPGLRTRWADGDEAERRAVLDEVPPGPPELDPATMGQGAAWPDGVDWFATGADLCAAHVALAERSQTEAGAPVRAILAANPGFEVDQGTWDHVAYKGGSSVGTMAGAWYAEPTDGGAPVVVVVQTAAGTAQDAVPAATMVGIAQDALRLSQD